jgi:hypothetical protein
MWAKKRKEDVKNGIPVRFKVSCRFLNHLRALNNS